MVLPLVCMYALHVCVKCVCAHSISMANQAWINHLVMEHDDRWLGGAEGRLTVRFVGSFDSPESDTRYVCKLLWWLTTNKKRTNTHLLPIRLYMANIDQVLGRNQPPTTWGPYIERSGLILGCRAKQTGQKHVFSFIFGDVQCEPIWIIHIHFLASTHQLSFALPKKINTGRNYRSIALWCGRYLHGGNSILALLQKLNIVFNFYVNYS